MIFYTFLTPFWHLFDGFTSVRAIFELEHAVFSRSRWSLSLAGLVPSLGTCWVSTLCSSVVSPMTRQKKRCNSMKIYENYEPIAVSLVALMTLSCIWCTMLQVRRCMRGLASTVS
jgi:hypothetical protein